jgi:hypothetical protein
MQRSVMFLHVLNVVVLVSPVVSGLELAGRVHVHKLVRLLHVVANVVAKEGTSVAKRTVLTLCPADGGNHQMLW